MSNAATDSVSRECNQVLSLESLFGVKGLVAVVTGGGTGIGLMFTKALAAHGARVYITGRRLEVLQNVVDKYDKHVAGEIISIQADITALDDLARLAKEIEEREAGGIQILINNAGILPSGAAIGVEQSFEDLCSQYIKNESFSEWDSIWRTNVAGSFFSTVHLLPLLKRGSQNKMNYRSGVINISSAGGMIKIAPPHFSYNASKAAVIHLTKMMATELGKYNIRFNSIAPGLFPSQMTSGSEVDDCGNSIIPDSFNIDEWKVPAGRTGTLQEMAATVLYLCGRGGQYCDGLVMNVDGGILLTNPSTA